jgi:hypothetical protein
MLGLSFANGLLVPFFATVTLLRYGTGGNTPCMTLTMKKGKVAQVKFAIKTKNVPLE